MAQLKSDVHEATKDLWVHNDPVCEFPGGSGKLREWINANIQIPEGYKGCERVIVKFYVQPDGSITDAKLFRPSKNNDANAEALRLVGALPKFRVKFYTPQKHRIGLMCCLSLSQSREQSSSEANRFLIDKKLGCQTALSHLHPGLPKSRDYEKIICHPGGRNGHSSRDSTTQSNRLRSGSGRTEFRDINRGRHEFFNNDKSIIYEKILILTILSLAGVLQMPAQGYVGISSEAVDNGEYIPLLKEGKVWVWNACNEGVGYDFSVYFTVVGQEEIDGRNCFRITQTSELEYLNGYEYILFEENRKVKMRFEFEDGHAEFLPLYDFNIKPGMESQILEVIESKVWPPILI